MYKVIDLFAGAGGLSLGFKQTGECCLLAAAEIKKDARNTYKKNLVDSETEFEFIENVIGYDFESLNEQLGEIDIVIGGPPCQGFSNANRQKNHLINLNNALVKEYFRAIREIKPKAFIMENVSMLQSDTHRFYDSQLDHDMIEAMQQQGKNIPMRIDKITICSRDFYNIDTIKVVRNIEKVEQLLLPEKLLALINTLNKNKNNKRRLPNFLLKNKTNIVNGINEFVVENELVYGEMEQIKNWANVLRQGLLEDRKVSEITELQDLVEFEKMLLSVKEIYQNQLIGIFEQRDNGIVFIVKSYSVLDYINAILGNDYIQKGETLNAQCFEVPQERKRYIVFGIRTDILGKQEFQALKNPDTYTTVTVKEAIDDLTKYDVGYDKEFEPVAYREGEELSEYAKEIRRNSTSVKNHISTNTTEAALERFRAIEQGKNFHSLSNELKTTYAKPERTQNTIYLRLNPDKVCGTVVNVRKSMWIHPTLNRAISVREAARLQSFPDEFEFVGTKDSQYQQVGNAVPPKLAKKIAEHILKYLKNNDA